MNSILTILGTFLVAVLFSALLAPFFIDWNAHRPFLEAQASRLLGEKIVLAGDVSVRFLPVPRVRASSVRIGDPVENAKRGMAAVARTFSLELSIPALLRGQIEASTLVLDAPVMHITLADGAPGTGPYKAGSRGFALPPGRVALSEVVIRQGVMKLSHPASGLVQDVEAIDGVFSASSLAGPFRFTGAVRMAGVHHVVRFSTGAFNPVTGMALKASIRREGTGEAVTLDGVLTGGLDHPVYDGEVAFRRDGETADGDADAASVLSPGGDEKAGAGFLDVTAKLKADLRQARVRDITIRAGAGTNLQTISGAGEVEWHGKPAITAAFYARRIDLGALAGVTGGKAAPGGDLAAAGRLLSLAARKVSIRALGLETDLLVIGGTEVAMAGMELKSAPGDAPRLRFSANLPGKSHLAGDGRLENAGGAMLFHGAMDIEGERLADLLKWADARPGGDLGAVARQKTKNFALAGRVTAGPGRFDMTDAAGSLGETEFNGSLRYSAAGQGRGLLKANLDADALDLASTLPPDMTLDVFLKRLMGQPEPGVEKQPPEGAARWAKNHDAQLNWRIARLILPGLKEGPAAANIRLERGDLYIDDMRASVAGGELKASGEITDLFGTAQGSLTAALKAPSGKALTFFAGMLTPVATLPLDSDRLDAFAPAVLDISLDAAGRDEGTKAAYTAAGSFAGTTFNLKGTFTGMAGKAREAQITLKADLRNDDGADLLRQLTGKTSKSKPSGKKQETSGALTLTADGIPGEGISFDIEASIFGSMAGGKGRVTAGVEKTSLAADLFVTSRDAVPVLAALGLVGKESMQTLPLSLNGRLKGDGPVYELSGAKGRFAGSRLRASGSADLSGETPKVEAEVYASHLSLPAVLGFGLGIGRIEGDDFWPQARFETGWLEAAETRIVVTAGRLTLVDAIALEGADMSLESGKGELTIGDLSGKYLGGDFKGSASFKSAAGGGVLTRLTASLKDARLDALLRAGDGKPLAQGKLGLSAEIAGKGLSPRGLMAALSGTGRITLGPGVIHGLRPDALAGVEEGASKEVRAKREAFAAHVREKLGQGDWKLAGFGADFTISNGVVTARDFKVAGEGGEAEVTSYVDFASLGFDSEWRLKSPVKGEKALPDVTVTFAGPLKDLGKVAPLIEAELLRNSYAMRRMEQDVKRLEHLEEEVQKAREAKEKLSSLPVPEKPKEPVLPIPPPPIDVTPQNGVALPASPGQKEREAFRKQIEDALKVEPEAKVEAEPPAPEPPPAPKPKPKRSPAWPSWIFGGD